MGKKVTLLQFQVLNMAYHGCRLTQQSWCPHSLCTSTWPRSKVELCSRGRCSGVRGGGGFPDAADALAENDQ